MKTVGTLPESKRPKVEETIRELVKQRGEYVSQIKAGEPMLQVCVDFIDNTLAQFIPSYEPPKGHLCKCKHH